MKKMLLSLTLCASLLLPLFPFGAKAAGTENAAEAEQPIAELTLSPNRTKGIVSMTFDDGSIPTAQWLNEKFKQYDLYGSTMLITSKNISSQENIDIWNSIYADGRLEPQCHTYTHMVLPSDLWANANDVNTLQNNTAENYKRELYDSGVMIQETFGKFPLCLAPSNNTMSEDGLRYLKQYYYAMRQGSRYNSGELQSLDPTPGSHDRGGWYNLLMSGTKNSEGRILEGLTTAARQGGWLVVMCHGIGEKAGQGDTTYEAFEPILQQMSTLQESGLVWVTTFGNATRYIRQRQNTRVNIARITETTYRVSLTMENYTADGLPLPKDEFNLPLTVKFRLPKGATHMAYDLGDGESYLEGIEEEDGTFAYLNMRAGEDIVNVRFCNADGQDILDEDIFTMKHGLSMSDRFTYTLYVKSDVEIVSASIAGGDDVSGSDIPKKVINNENYSALSYTVSPENAPRIFSVSLVARVDGKEGVFTLQCSLFDYLKELLDDEFSQEVQMLALNTMILLRDMANEKKISVDTSSVQDAILAYHYMPKAPDEFKAATVKDTSSICATLSFDFTEGFALKLTPNESKSTVIYAFVDASGNELSVKEKDGSLLLPLSLRRVTDEIKIVYKDGGMQTSVSYSLADDYARVKNVGLLATLYVSLYHTSLATQKVE